MSCTQEQHLSPDPLTSLLNRFRSFCFDLPAISMVRYWLIAAPLAVIPSIVLVAAIWQALTWLGVDVTLLQRSHQGFSWELAFGAVVFAPLVETFLLAGLLALLSMAPVGPVWIRLVSAFLWGFVHGVKGVMYFFGTVWAFFIFSSAYLVWRKLSFRQAFIAAALPHAVNNTFAMFLMYLDRQ